jgi:hypothetical protein
MRGKTTSRNPVNKGAGGGIVWCRVMGINLRLLVRHFEGIREIEDRKSMDAIKKEGKKRKLALSWENLPLIPLLNASVGPRKVEESQRGCGGACLSALRPEWSGVKLTVA